MWTTCPGGPRPAAAGRTCAPPQGAGSGPAQPVVICATCSFIARPL